ncbi:MAG: hypothetical protein LBU50_07755 [Cellulomonas sp.]|jgi:hypothetical protein|nr:hypothetical protein [Cellulomonas sp.]
MRWLVVLATVLTVLALPFTGRVLWVAYGPVSDDPLAQLRYLDAALDRGGATTMQDLFPEGEFFTWVLSGVAAGRVAQDPDVSADDQAFARDLAERALTAVDEPAVAGQFGQVPELEHGVFYRGWRLTLLNEIAAWDEAAAARAAAEATAILAAVDASATGWVDAYPGQAWPCDTVVALAAATAADPQAAAPVVGRWLERTGDALDPATGLLAHQVDAAGRAVGGARGSSQSIIATFWPQLVGPLVDQLVDPAASTAWTAYSETFVARRLGVVGTLEHADGGGAGDVDSGPLVLGLSASASAVTQAAARANGDTALADRLNRQIELIAVPWQTGDRRTYLFGQVPVAVAFFVWADTTPVGEPVSSTAPRPAWWALAGLPALPAVAAWGALALVAGRRRRHRPPGQAWPTPPGSQIPLADGRPG